MAFLDQLGFSSLTPGMVFTGSIGLVLIYLALVLQFRSFLDLAAELPDEQSLFTDGIHFTKSGNQHRAELLVEHLIAQGIRTSH